MTNSSDANLISGIPGKISSLCVPFDVEPGFAIPLVRTDIRSNTCYVQRVSRSRHVIGFDPFYDKTKIVELSDTFEVEVGDKEFFGIVDPYGFALAGTRLMLVPLVSSWLEEVPEPLSKLVFARFCGNVQATYASAVEVVRDKTKEFEDEKRAIRWFIDIAVIPDLVTMLSRGLSQEEDTFEIGAIWSEVSHEGRVKINLPKKILGDQGAFTKSYSRQLAGILELARVATGKDFDLVSSEQIAGTDEESQRTRVLRIGRDIARIKRQERRIAEIVKVLIFEPNIGRVLLDTYQDRSLFVNQTLKGIRALPHEVLSGEQSESTFAEILPSIVRSAYPMQKGNLLLEFALKLNRSQLISEVIGTIVSRSKARDVEAVRGQILKVLTVPSEAR